MKQGQKEISLNRNLVTDVRGSKYHQKKKPFLRSCAHTSIIIRYISRLLTDVCTFSLCNSVYLYRDKESVELNELESYIIGINKFPYLVLFF